MPQENNEQFHIRKENVAVTVLDEEERVVRLSFSSEFPVRRYSWRYDEEYDEVLGHGEDEVMTERLNSKAPLLKNHWNGIGVVEKGWIEGRRGHAEVRLSKRDEVAGLWRDIQDGIVSSVSVGYRIHETNRIEKKGALTTVRATLWEPYEISILDVPPADYTVGVGRSGEDPEQNFLTRHGGNAMPQETNGQAAEKRDADPVPVPGLTQDDLERAAAQAQEETRRAEQQRRDGVKAVFTDAWRRDYSELYQQCLDDMECAPDKARQLLLKKLGEDSGGEAGGEPDMSHRIQMQSDERDKTRRGAVSSILQRAGFKPGEADKDLFAGANEFRGLTLVEIARVCLQRCGVNTSGMYNMEIVGRAFTQSSSDFPVILENVMHKEMLARAQALAPTWQRWCARGTATDFREMKKLNRGFFGSLDSLNELGEFVNKAIPDAVSEKARVGTKGNIANISRQAVVDDDLGYFMDIAAMFGMASTLTIEVAAYTALKANPAMNEDSKALFHADHNNLAGTGAVISVTTLDAARSAMAMQKDHTGKQYIMVDPWVLLVPVNQFGNSVVVVGAEYDPDTANKFHKPNMVRDMVQDIVKSPYLTMEGATPLTAWYVLANPAIHPVVLVSFLNGQESPVIEQQTGFTVDGYKVKCRLDVGADVVGWRGAYKNEGA